MVDRVVVVPVVLAAVVPVVLAAVVLAGPVVVARVHRVVRVHPALDPLAGEPPARSLGVVWGLPAGLAVRVERW